MPEPQDPAGIFKALTSRFSGRMDIKLTTGPDDAPLLKASGQSFAMLHDEQLVVRLYPERCTELVEAGKGKMFVHNGEPTPEWIIIDGHDPAEWKAHAMEALGCAKD